MTKIWTDGSERAVPSRVPHAAPLQREHLTSPSAKGTGLSLGIGIGPIVEPRPVPMVAADRQWLEPFEWLRTDPAALHDLTCQESVFASRALTFVQHHADRLVTELADEAIRQELPPGQALGDYWYLPVLRPGALTPQVVRTPRAGEALPTAEDILRGAAHEVVLDFQVAMQGRVAGVGAVTTSPCGQFVAWTEDASGAERYTLRVRAVGVDTDLASPFENTSAKAVLSSDPARLFWSEVDEANRPWRVWAAPVADLGAAQVIFTEPDAGYRVRVRLSASGKLLLIESRSRVATRLFVLSVGHLDSSPVPLVGPAGDEPFASEHAVIAGKDAIVATSSGPSTPNGQLCLLYLDEPGSGWQVLVEHDEAVRLSPPIATERALICGTRRAGLDDLLVAGTESSELRFIPVVASGGVSVGLVGAPEWSTRTLDLGVSSWTTKPSVRTHPISALTVGPNYTLKPTRSLGNDDPYREEMLYAHASDGELIPLTVLRRVDVARPGPCLISGYGAYDSTQKPSRNALLLKLLDAGLTWAFAHVRGSGAKGEGWHTQATGTGKPVSFTDFLACVDHLVATGLAAPDQVAAMGGSAGGLLVGRALTLAPTRFAAVVLDSPFVDPFVTMLHPELPLTVNDRGEWGDPISDPDVAACMRSYSPCHTVTAFHRPPVLMSVGTHDSRVNALEGLKFAQRLRAEATGQNPVVVHVRDGGHTGGASVREKLWTTTMQMLWAAHHAGVDLGAL